MPGSHRVFPDVNMASDTLFFVWENGGPNGRSGRPKVIESCLVGGQGFGYQQRQVSSPTTEERALSGLRGSGLSFLLSLKERPPLTATLLTGVPIRSKGGKLKTSAIQATSEDIALVHRLTCAVLRRNNAAVTLSWPLTANR